MSQSLAKIYIHLVFSTKGRTDTIPKANLEDVHAYMAEIFNNHGCSAIQVGGTTNHVHILFFLTSSLVRYFYLPHDGTYGFKGVSEDLTGDAG